MTRRSLFVLAWLAALTIGSAATTMTPAVAQGSCDVSHSWSSVAVVLRLTASASCTGGPITINACILHRPAGGTWVNVTCGAGGGTNSASATTATVCVPGQVYRGQITVTAAAFASSTTTAPVTCPPLL